MRTKLLLERMAAGEIAEVRLTEGEPLENVPRSVRDQGHEVLSLEPEGDTAPGGGAVYRLVIRKR